MDSVRSVRPSSVGAIRDELAAGSREGYDADLQGIRFNPHEKLMACLRIAVRDGAVLKRFACGWKRR